MKILNVSALVLPWEMLRYRSPILLRATIMLIRGLTMGFSTEFVDPGNFHLRLRKSVLDNQVSSMLMITKSYWNSSIILNAYSCLRIKFFSELPEKGIHFILLYFIPISFLRTFLKRCRGKLIYYLSFRAVWSCLALKIYLTSFISYKTVCIIFSFKIAVFSTLALWF
jgi:hypothetical protein